MRNPLLILTCLLGCALSMTAWSQPIEVLNLKDKRWAAYDVGASDQAVRLGLDGLKAQVERLAPSVTGWFDGRPNTLTEPSPSVKIHYRFYENPQETKGGVVIVSGRTEGLALYQEVIADLLRHGWSVYIHDHRGQGFSSRLSEKPSDSSKGHIDQFQHYVDDLGTFTQMVAGRRVGNSKPMVLLAHSMGGAVSSLYLANSAHPYKGAAMITPMHQPWLSGAISTVYSRVADHLCQTVAFNAPFSLFSISSAYVVDQDFDSLKQDFEQDSITSSPERLKLNWTARADTCAGDTCGHGSAKVGGPTFRWLNQACAAARVARGTDAAKTQVPVLLFQGELDTVVSGEGQREYCKHANAGKREPTCKLIVVPGGRHALHIERDEIRRPVMGRTLNFLECVASGSPRCF